MPTYSRPSRQNLDTCHPDLIVLMETVLEAGYDHSILCGARNEEEQNKAYAEKRSTKQWPDSKHNIKPDDQGVSWALDAAPFPVIWPDKIKRPTTVAKDLARFYQFIGYVRATASMLYKQGVMEHKIRVGSDWNGDFEILDNKFDDLPHIELVR